MTTTTTKYGLTLDKLSAMVTKVTVVEDWTPVALEDYKQVELGRVEYDEVTVVYVMRESGNEVEELRFYM